MKVSRGPWWPGATLGLLHARPITVSYLLDRLPDQVHLENHLRDADFLVVQCRVNLFFDFGFGDVVDGEAVRRAGKSSGPGRIAFGHSHRVQLGSLRGRRAQQDDQVIGPDPVDRLLDLYLTFQVKCSRGSSNEAVRDRQRHLGSKRVRYFGEDFTLDSVAFAERYDLLAVQLHVLFLLSSFRALWPAGHFSHPVRRSLRS